MLLDSSINRQFQLLIYMLVNIEIFRLFWQFLLAFFSIISNMFTSGHPHERT
jgi:hypothetical protein